MLSCLSLVASAPLVSMPCPQTKQRKHPNLVQNQRKKEHHKTIGIKFHGLAPFCVNGAGLERAERPLAARTALHYWSAYTARTWMPMRIARGCVSYRIVDADAHVPMRTWMPMRVSHCPFCKANQFPTIKTTLMSYVIPVQFESRSVANVFVRVDRVLLLIEKRCVEPAASSIFIRGTPRAIVSLFSGHNVPSTRSISSFRPPIPFSIPRSAKRITASRPRSTARLLLSRRLAGTL
jgi:hypothetical protein